jgi:hypothetical protein
MTAPEKHYRRMLRNVRHGNPVVPPPNGRLEIAEVSSPFDYLFADLATAFPAHHLPDSDPAAVTAALKRLGEAMIEAGGADPLDPDGNSVIPAVYTYWGQFIDHDITANTDRNSTVTDVTMPVITPLAPEVVRRDLRNLRQPALNLDSVYGEGPDFGGAGTESGRMYDGIRMRLGRLATRNDDGNPFGGDVIPPADDLDGDLPRDGSTAVIGDARNDENLIVAQFHVAMLRFHNAVVDDLRRRQAYPKSEPELFAEARDLVRWHYQWLVVHDYLKTIAMPGVVDKVLLDGNRHFTVGRGGDAYMPLEFSVAAYRFGHSMVRAAYDFNANFGRGNGTPPQIPFAPFGLLFAFTGGARPPFVGATTTLPGNWRIQWERFVDKGDGVSDHFARPIDTHIAPPLFDMVNQVDPADTGTSDEIKTLLKRLAVRNLLRGYQLSLPTGQAVAAKLGARVLTAEELQRGTSDEVDAALTAGGFLERTPLWFYVLKEAEIRCHGNFLGEVGSRIVAETLIGQLRADPESYLGRGYGWNPADGVRLADGEPIVTITDLFRFAGVFPADAT